jgi:GTPase SAR1 family protein
MVVVGDQSAGKSSVLESLTGFQFPRSATLCTRHATEIVCRREPIESVVVSIIPHNPSPEREKLIRKFRRSTDNIISDNFPKIFEDVGGLDAILSINSSMTNVITTGCQSYGYQDVRR